MGSEWRTRSLSEIYDFSSGLSKPRSAFGSGYPFLSFKDVFYNSAVPKQLASLVESTKDERARASIKRGDVFLTRTSETINELGMSSVALFDISDATFNGFTKRLRPKFDLIAPEFARYFFRSPGFRAAVNAMSTMSTRASLNNEMLENLKITFPNYGEQEVIGHILGTLDDKIELNRKQNETLEAMARALFKAWFVDFEPVRAKMEGRWQRGQSLPGMPVHLYDLFPERLVESDLGVIPEGWKVGSFSDAVDIIGGGTPKTSVTKYWNGEIPWFSVVDTPSKGEVFVVQTEKSITKAGLNGSSVRMIPKGTTIISARGTVGNLAIAGRDMVFNQSCYALRGKGGFESYFVFLLAQLMVEELKAMSHGSVFSTITRQTFDAVRCVLPSKKVSQQFEKNAAVLFSLILFHVNESRMLAQLRDTLLPKLISGELRVPDVGQIVEETL